MIHDGSNYLVLYGSNFIIIYNCVWCSLFTSRFQVTSLFNRTGMRAVPMVPSY